jgi:hypothetical protein
MGTNQHYDVMNIVMNETKIVSTGTSSTEGDGTLCNRWQLLIWNTVKFPLRNTAMSVDLKYDSILRSVLTKKFRTMMKMMCGLSNYFVR